MKPYTLILTALLLVGCATSPQPRTEYLLRSNATIESHEFKHGAVPINLGRITVANYLDQPGIVTAEPDGSIIVSNFSQWAEPLHEGLRSFIAQELSSDLKVDVIPTYVAGQDGLQVDVAVDQFHGDADGYAVLVAYWTYSIGEERFDFQYTGKRALEHEGYAGLVAAKQQVLSDLVAEIAAELRAR